MFIGCFGGLRCFLKIYGVLLWFQVPCSSASVRRTVGDLSLGAT